MHRRLRRLEVPVFRLATVLVAALAAVLMLVGMERHGAARWMLGLILLAAANVAAAWVIGTRLRH